VNDLRQAAQYTSNGIEEKWYKEWEESGYFAPDGDGEPFVITLPPPNVTGVLHMGHCLSNSIQDVLIRWMRMRGRETLWIPGTDHASIATEQIVSKQLRADGIDKHELGRDKFLERAWEWKEHTHGVITNQLRRLGCSLDWSREAFTMDQQRSEAVSKAFTDLYERGLIYRDLYLVNWCPHCLTAISDDEVEHKEKESKLWRINYPLVDGSGHITVATTRPETMFGDTAVAVNPDDPERKHLIGKMVKLPLTTREIPIIADYHADPEKGTGFVKITPAHDPNDFEVGRRNDLERVICMDEHAVMNDNAGKYSGMDRFECRKAVLIDLESEGFYDGDEKNINQVGHHDRCHTIIEPYLSRQWFLKMDELAAPAVSAVKDGTVKLHPERWVGVYDNWMGGIRDWCISRQLWWGHRIPVWYCQECGQEICSNEEPSTCSKCNSTDLQQDNDVLDTWFSSWLWTFSPLGWPNGAEDLKKYHPTSVLVTGPDIIFFWVARMIMASYGFMNEEPFREVLFHGIVRDGEGRKMSKSLGNSPDPIDLIDKYGSDALRCSLMMLTPTGQDVSFSEDTIEVGRNFCNKVFQATKLVLNYWDQTEIDAPKGDSASAKAKLSVAADGPAALWKETFGVDSPVEFDAENMELEDCWILNRLAETADQVNGNLEKRRLNDALYSAYNFFRHDLCDWYLELIKPRLRDDDLRPAASSVAVLCLAHSYKLLHPFMPFITEELWSWLPCADGSIMTSSFPVADGTVYKERASRFERVKEIVTVIRNLRSELDVPPGLRGSAILRADKAEAESLTQDLERIALLSKLEEVSVVVGGEDPSPAGVGLAGKIDVFLPMEGLVDVEKEKERLTRELGKLEGFISGSRKKLENEKFTSRAPEQVIDREKKQLKDNEDKAEAIRQLIASFDS